MARFDELREQVTEYLDNGRYLMARSVMTLFFMEARDDFEKQEVHSLEARVYSGQADHDAERMDQIMGNICFLLGRVPFSGNEKYSRLFLPSANDAVIEHLAQTNRLNLATDVDLSFDLLWEFKEEVERGYAASERCHKLALSLKTSEEATGLASLYFLETKAKHAVFLYNMGKLGEAKTKADEAEGLISQNTRIFLMNPAMVAYTHYLSGLLRSELYLGGAKQYIDAAVDLSDRCPLFISQQISTLKQAFISRYN